MCVSPDGQQVALLAQGVNLVKLPQLNRDVGVGSSRNMLRCAAFSSDGSTLIAGRFNGDVIVYGRRQHTNWLAREPGTLTHHEGRVEGVEVLRGRSIVVTAGSEGVIRFMSLKGREIIGEVQDPLGQVTSLHVSPDGSFMAVGNSKASLSLWDLRVLDAQALLEHPFARAQPALLATLNVLMDNENLDPRARLALKFTDCVLRHRFRFDIELGEAPTIMMGEFDIEIEE
jgi:WD40 repeat protein